MSIQAMILKRYMRKRRLNTPPDLPVEVSRKGLESIASKSPLPDDLTSEAVMIGAVPGEWVRTPDVQDDQALFYLHGGGYCLGSPGTHRALVGWLGHEIGVRAILIDYRLAPENPYPAALEDALAGYRWLLEEIGDASKIVLAGDSAGGGLTMAMLLSLRDAGDPLPAGVTLLSPWVDLVGTGESLLTRQKWDWISAAEMIPVARLYAGEADLKSPLISPLYGDHHGLPPTLIQVGTDEILFDDATRLAERMQAAGVDVQITRWKGMFHVFQSFSQLPEAWKARREMGEFLRARLNGAGANAA